MGDTNRLRPDTGIVVDDLVDSKVRVGDLVTQKVGTSRLLIVGLENLDGPGRSRVLVLVIGLGQIADPSSLASVRESVTG